MASNKGSGSANPTNKNTKNEKLTRASNAAASIPAAWPQGETVIETESQSLHTEVPTGKRQRTSSANDNRNNSSGQAASSRSENAVQIQQQNMILTSESTNLTPPFRSHPYLATNYLPSELRQHRQQQQQLEVTQNNSQILQSQLQELYSLQSAQRFIPPNMSTLMMANQLRQAGETAPFIQIPPVQPNNELQQLTVLLQQHLHNDGLAQALEINLPSRRDAVGSAFASAQPSFTQPSSQLLQQFVINSDTFPATLQATAAINNTNNLPSGAPPSIHTRSDDTLARMYRSLPTAPPNDSNSSSGISGRPPIPLYISCDDDSLSAYQCLVRKHIELFEAGVDDVESNAQGRNRPIVLGQVGIRCRHCTMLPPRIRYRGAMYYPAKLLGIYQAAQNLAMAHLGEHCQNVPEDVRATLIKLRERKSSAGGGKHYWANGVRALGVFEDRDGLRFVSQFTPNSGAIL